MVSLCSDVSLRGLVSSGPRRSGACQFSGPCCHRMDGDRSATGANLMSWAVAQTLPDAAQPAAALPGPRLPSPHPALRQPRLLRRRAAAEPELRATSVCSLLARME